MGEREGAILSQQILEFLHSSICLKPYQICGGWMVVVGGWCLFPILVFSFSKSWSREDIILQATFVVFCFIWNNFARPNPPLSLPLKLQFGPRIHFNFFSFQIIQCLPVMFWAFSWELGFPSVRKRLVRNLQFPLVWSYKIDNIWQLKCLSSLEFRTVRARACGHIILITKLSLEWFKHF